MIGQGDGEVVSLFLPHRTLVSASLDLIEQYATAPAQPCSGEEIVEARGDIRELVKDEEVV